MSQFDLYGKRTSKQAKRLIIDLFNRINAGKPYIMKTFTTIYKNDAIFPGNLRYPIDAPYRNFYKSLTEKYVVEHKLDNIFFDKGEAKEGKYFFEFYYEKESNRFNIYECPKELEFEISASYIPMLYSMITGKKINWEDARTKVKFCKNNNEVSTKVLLVFGKDTLQTLEFGWLATFQLLISSNKQVEKVAADIRKLEPEIISFTQGVLFTELEDIIIGFLQSQKQFELTKNLIINHQHTLKNFGFTGALNYLYVNIKDDPELVKIYDYVENLASLRDYATDILYNFGNSPRNLLLNKEGINTYTKILELINSTIINKCCKKVEYHPLVENHHLNNIHETDLADVFTVLLNLYSNCRNYGQSFCEVSLSISDDDNLKITFKNDGIMPQRFKDYFLNYETRIYENEGEGIGFVRGALNQLRHIKRYCNTDDNFTYIILIIHYKDGPI